MSFCKRKIPITLRWPTLEQLAGKLLKEPERGMKQRNQENAEYGEAKLEAARLREARELLKSSPNCTGKEIMKELQAGGNSKKERNTRFDRSAAIFVDKGQRAAKAARTFYARLLPGNIRKKTRSDNVEITSTLSITERMLEKIHLDDAR